MLLSIFCGEFIDPKVLNVFVYIFYEYKSTFINILNVTT